MGEPQGRSGFKEGDLSPPRPSVLRDCRSTWNGMTNDGQTNSITFPPADTAIVLTSLMHLQI